MLLLFIGSTACRGGKTICSCLRALGMKGETAFANYHHFLSRCQFSSLEAAKILTKIVLELAGPNVVLIIDEHLERRRGKKITAKAIYRDPVASSKQWLVKCFGLKWIVISVLVKFSWSKRPFALPVFCALRYPEDHPKNVKRKTRSGIDIVCQMLHVIRRWFPYVSFTVLGDGDYARVKLCQVCHRLSMTLITRMRADARLHNLPMDSGKNKRKKKLGERILKPEESSWEKITVKWYGGQIKELIANAQNCLWIAGKKSAIIPLKAIWVNMRANDQILLITTTVEMSVVEVIEAYVKRWNLEVTFRECRDHLGIETQRQWSNLAILRTTPLLFGLYTLIVLIGDALYKEKGIQIESTAWYRKTHLTFSDLLEAVRTELGDVRIIVNSLLNSELMNSFFSEDHLFDPQRAAAF